LDWDLFSSAVCVEENDNFYSLVFEDLMGWYLLSKRCTVAV